MRNRLALVLVLIAAAACSKSESPTSPTVSTPPPVATPAPAPAPEATPAPNPAPTPAPAPTPPAPSNNTAVYSTLKGPNSTEQFGADLVGATRAGSGTFDGQVYDDFVIPNGATIRTISWQGVRTAAGPPLRFYVAFIADNGDRRPRLEWVDYRPVPLWSFTYAMAQVSERLEVSLPCPNSPQVQCGYYDYAVGLATPFVAAPGTKYWLMIQGEIDFGAVNGFSWRKGIRDNSWSLPGPQYANTTFPWDMSFALRP